MKNLRSRKVIKRHYDTKQAAWLLDIGQTKIKGLSDIEQARLVYDDIFYRRIGGYVPAWFRAKLRKEYKQFPFEWGDLRKWPRKDSAEYTNFVKKHFQLASEFLQGLTEFVSKLRKYKDGTAEAPPLPGNYVLREFQGSWTMQPGTDETAKPVGPLELMNILNGNPFDSLKVCQNCEKLFFSTNNKRKNCSERCTKASNYSSSRTKVDYDFSRRLISSKRYYKKLKWSHKDIAQKWADDGVPLEWIRRYFPYAKPVVDFDGTS